MEDSGLKEVCRVGIEGNSIVVVARPADVVDVNVDSDVDSDDIVGDVGAP